MGGYHAIGEVGSKDERNVDKLAFWQKKELNPNITNTGSFVAFDIGNYLNGTKAYT